jgi:hypothetical protein
MQALSTEKMCGKLYTVYLPVYAWFKVYERKVQNLPGIFSWRSG